MLADWAPVGVMFALAAVFATGSVVMARLISPMKRNPIKEGPYECGMEPLSLPQDRLAVKFYRTALLFVIFDVEAVFLYPWAVVLRQLGTLAWAEMAVFVAFLAAAYAYVWREGGLEWER